LTKNLAFSFWAKPDSSKSENALQSFSSQGDNRFGKLRPVTATFLNPDGDGLLAEVDLQIYGREALMKVVYKFTDRCFIHLQHRDERIVEVRFQPKTSEISLKMVAGEFFNDLLDQQLREVVGRESEQIRNLILAHALSKTDFALSDPENPQAP
jgi:His-Xaa-Ser system protein HxsD